MYAADNVVPIKPSSIEEQREILRATFGDESHKADRTYRSSMTIDRYTLMQRFELGLLPPGAFCQLALEMDQVGAKGPEAFDVEDFIDRWKVSTGFKFNKKTGEEEETFKKLNAAVVNRELLRLEKATKTSVVQKLTVEIDYNQGYEEE